MIELDHRLQAEQAEGVIQKMRRREREQNEPGPEPYPLRQASPPQDIHRRIASVREVRTVAILASATPIARLLSRQLGPRRPDPAASCDD
jgi:hypothetical protein